MEEQVANQTLGMLRNIAAKIVEIGSSPDVVYVHPRAYQRFNEFYAYQKRVGYDVARLTEKQRCRLVTRYSDGRHHKRKRYLNG